ncbi:ferredoxin [Streptomyces sp. 4F14]|uniref:ferredoxin n=1 Tax=Streptomyces sp. 4F14 TaxID=3394380 RepID=UPI003A87DDDE
MRVAVDEDRCRGHGICHTLCPTVFDLTEDGYATAEQGDVPQELEQTARSAAASCPESAISWH